ncbi:MAG: PHP domain-containing protein [Nitrospiraceae bacterium]|nr:MAG: PHP domain-containing protein [Nitrospiraceae bacterium]
MTFKIDLHVHSKFSGDTDSEPEESVIHAVRAGLQGVAFTEHYSYEASEFAEGLREKYRGRIMVFRGVEFSTAEGHCLVFGVNTDMLTLKNAPVEDVVRAVTEKGGVVIPAHPYRVSNSIGVRVKGLRGLCALEGHNGYAHYYQNQKALQAAEEMGLPYTGGSDAHEPRETGACYTEFVHEVTQDNLLERLKGGAFKGVDTRKISRVWPF